MTGCALRLPNQALLLHLLTERALGPASFWSPYIAVLPQDMVRLGAAFAFFLMSRDRAVRVKRGQVSLLLSYSRCFPRT